MCQGDLAESTIPYFQFHTHILVAFVVTSINYRFQRYELPAHYEMSISMFGIVQMKVLLTQLPSSRGWKPVWLIFNMLSAHTLHMAAVLSGGRLWADNAPSLDSIASLLVAVARPWGLWPPLLGTLTLTGHSLNRRPGICKYRWLGRCKVSVKVTFIIK